MIVEVAAGRTVGAMTARTTESDTRTMRERMLAGDPYIGADPEIAEELSVAQDLTGAYNATSIRQGSLRARILAALLRSIGPDSEIRPPLRVDYGYQITIGARCFVNS